MTLPPGVRGLVLAAVAAVVTSAGAVAVLLHPQDGTRKITGTVDAAPGLAWSVDAAERYGRASAEFRDPVNGSEYGVDAAGFVDAGRTVVSMIGIPDDTHLRDPALIGIDAETGATRWQVPADGLVGCASAPVHGQLVCYTAERSTLVGFDIDSGTVTRTPVPWLVFGLAAVDDRVYTVEGDVESDDVRVHAGTLADPDAYWTRAFAMGTGWDDVADVLDVAHGQGTLEIGADIAGFDLDTGAQTWTAPLGCGRATPTVGALVVRTRTDCDDRLHTTVDILDRTGRAIVTEVGADIRLPTLERPADDTVPVLLADSAYDRRDGTLRWTSPDLAPGSPESDSTTVYVVGDVVLRHDAAARTLTALNLRTGQRLWRIETDRFGDVEASDGHTVVLRDATGLWAVERRTGETIWDIPFLAVNTDHDAFTGGGALGVENDGRYLYAAPHTMIGLRPIR
ncbi:outer membrane protein assembly factor BamB family protein [Nocardia bovistercoris]|uniref:PQQ-binding-like beta-propeller repeat protein n=1 Tax=Nocardia bovistercoris TaxID=2785916 RepID=A0A931IF13_9NOCA|nr:PQQ-binding-like beta-propeller repeat protein [Nocardia bovistercoris]MBH0779353.1 PQQ-binding-like beta-propeller repeat protein [Nocardia bovistercoris]